MEVDEVQQLINERVDLSLRSHRQEMLSDIEKIVEKISGSSNVSQLNKLSTLVNGGEKFKRKSNEEQFKYNSSVSLKLEEAEHSLEAQNIQAGREKIIEAKALIAQRQKLIKMADASELGWRVVNEYVTNPLASDSEDEKRIYKAEARATRKYNAEKVKKRKRSRSAPYWKQSPKQQSFDQPTVVASSQQPARRPPCLCFACGKPGHWKGSPECTVTGQSNNKISSDSLILDKTIMTHNSEVRCINEQVSLYECNLSTETESTVLNDQVTDDSQKVLSPIGRLQNCVSKWKEATNSKYIVDVVENGYKLPLKEQPSSVCLRNNKSARENLPFVRSEVQSLLKKGVVSKTDEIPYVVNPLTVAYNKKGKPRLVLDCRHINKCLHLFKVKFEDIRVAEAIFEENSYLYTWDLSSAYHHISISRDHISLLGFSIPDQDGNIMYYVFNSLPFGIKTAGHIFTKLLKVVVTFLRANGHKVIMFLDDGIGGHTDLDTAVQSSQYVKRTLLDFGFLLAHEKCQWLPARRVMWLGHIIDMEKNLLFISDERIKRLYSKLESILFQIKSDQYNIILVRALASVTGQIISLQSVIGNKVRLRTREMFKCINSRASWNAPVLVSEEALAEIEFWKSNLHTLSSQGKPLKDSELSLYNIFVDASAVGYGGYIEGNWQNFLPTQSNTLRCEVGTQLSKVDVSAFHASPQEVENIEVKSGSSETDLLVPSEKGSGCKEKSPEADESKSSVEDDLRNSFCTKQSPVSVEQAFMENSEVLGDWDEYEQGTSSTWRETEAVSRLVRSHVNVLKHSVVTVYSDNKNVKSILLNGSSKPYIQDIAINLNNFCDSEKITLRPEWIPREQNEKADYLSRCKDSDDWEISPKSFHSLNSRWGVYTVDRFASHLNNKCKRFNSRWWVPGTEAVDAMTQFWGRDLNWLVPPPRLIAECFGKMQLEKANGTLVIPLWKSSPYWPCLLDLKGVGLKDNLKQMLGEAGVCETAKDIISTKMAGYLLQSRADTTVKKYKCAFDQFINYCSSNKLSAKPALPIVVAMYITSLLDQGKSDNVVTAAVYGIKWAHNINGFSDPTENVIVKNLLEAAKRIASKPKQKKDIVSSEMLQTLCSSYTCCDDVIQLRDLCMITLAFAGFLRFNELSNLRCNDITFNSDHIVVKIRKSKTDIYRRGNEVLIAKGSSSACPYAMLQRYMAAANFTVDSDEYLFKPAYRLKKSYFSDQKEQMYKLHKSKRMYSREASDGSAWA